jgi:hypothetical protein
MVLQCQRDLSERTVTCAIVGMNFEYLLGWK